MAKATYRDAGVDLESYREAMTRLPALMRRTASPRVIGADGGFAGLFQLDFASPLFARHLPRSGAGGLHRWRWHQAEGRAADGRARHGWHRLGRHVRERLPLRGGGTVILSGLRCPSQGRSVPARADC